MSGRAPAEHLLWIGGWKEVSLVDVLESVSFTLWTAFCNLSCPWCANFKLAKGKERKLVSVEEIAAAVQETAAVVDYFHVTGGEPTLQYRPLTRLLKLVRETTGLKLSFDTNAMLPQALKHILSEVSVDHVAVDVKAPLENPLKYAAAAGVSAKNGEKVVEMVEEGLLSLSGRVPFLELRTTVVPSLLDEEDVQIIATEIAQMGLKAERLVYVVQQFIPYPDVPAEYRSLPATPTHKLERAASTAAQILNGVAEVWVRTLEQGSKRVSRPASSAREGR
ncbi:MAG: anaerobic ribonucleoside-triphosphate reductase activating protein [Thermofilum sp.]